MQIESKEKEAGQDIGTLFATVLTGIGLWPLLHDGSVNIQWFQAAFILLLITLLMPRLLAPVHKVWMRFAEVLSKITTPLVLGVLFFIIFAPVGLFLRLTRKDLLRISREAAHKESFWIKRDKEMPTSMRKQF